MDYFNVFLNEILLLTDMCARPLYKYLFKIWSRLTEKYKNCLKQGKTKN